MERDCWPGYGIDYRELRACDYGAPTITDQIPNRSYRAASNGSVADGNRRDIKTPGGNGHAWGIVEADFSSPKSIFILKTPFYTVQLLMK